jgi:tetratricopeptide (TPR) repeat protein
MIEEIEEKLRLAQWPEAQKLSEALLAEQPCSPQANAYLGLCFFRQGRFNEAVGPLQRAVTLDENYWEAGTKLAQALDRLQRYEEALEVVKQFLAVKPSDPTLIHLKNGLERNVPEKITDSWQKTVFLDHHQVELTHRD